MGILEVLTIVFVVLKLIGVIAWSWWIVLLPGIIALVLYVVIFSLQLLALITMKRTIGKEFDDDFFK